MAISTNDTTPKQSFGGYPNAHASPIRSNEGSPARIFFGIDEMEFECLLSLVNGKRCKWRSNGARAWANFRRGQDDACGYLDRMAVIRCKELGRFKRMACGA